MLQLTIEAWQKIRAGDDNEFECLMHSNFSYVTSYIRALLNRSEFDFCDVEDCSQHFFLSILSIMRSKEVSDVANVKAYAQKTLRNIVLKYVRKERAQRTDVRHSRSVNNASKQDVSAVEDSQQSPSQQAEANDEVDMLLRSIQQAPLTSIDRAVIDLEFLEPGLSSEDKGRLLGCSSAAYRRRLSSARRKLRRHLELRR